MFRRSFVLLLLAACHAPAQILIDIDFGAGSWGVGYDEPRKTYFASEPGITRLGIQSKDGLSAAWTGGVIDAGGMPYCDVMCYHQYTVGSPGSSGDAVETGLHRAFEPLLPQENAVLLKQRIGNGLYRDTLPYQDEEDVMDTADRLARWGTAALPPNVRKVFPYSEHSYLVRHRQRLARFGNGRRLPSAQFGRIFGQGPVPGRHRHRETRIPRRGRYVFRISGSRPLGHRVAAFAESCALCPFNRRLRPVRKPFIQRTPDWKPPRLPGLA